VRRLSGYADLPLFSLLATSEHDLARLEQAVAEIPPLLERGERALATIRSRLAGRCGADED